tara:strand:- start:2520 stop:2975 length:456 start_codon:yes stop_codon:yes gene_type:complete
MANFQIQEKLKELKRKIDELDNINVGENADIRKINIKNKISKVNKRKTFYLNQQINKVETSVIVLFSLYYIIFIGLLIVYIQKKLYKSKTSILIFVILAILPITINTIVDFFISIANRIQLLSPVNEYRSLYKNDLKRYFDLANFDLNDGE